MKILILGGTQFLGRHLTQACLDAGHEVTLFNRGQTNPGLFAGQAETVVGDRDGGLDALTGRQFDACIDPSGYVPRLVSASCEYLKDMVQHYTFVSSISVYPTFVPNQDETAPLDQLADPTVEEVTGETYGGLKVLCESAAEDILPGKVLHARSGLIIGPYDPTDRFSYWPLRIAQGDTFIAPDSPQVPVQIIDARDQAEWIVRCIAEETCGTFNVTGPKVDMSFVIDACQRVTGTSGEPVWLPEDVLLAHDVAPWMDLPVWVPTDMHGMMQISTARAEAAGLTCRPLEETIADILAWHPGALDNLAAGLQRDKESELLHLR